MAIRQQINFPYKYLFMLRLALLLWFLWCLTFITIEQPRLPRDLLLSALVLNELKDIKATSNEARVRSPS